MKRRRVLRSGLAALAVALAGCSADDGSPTDTATSTDTSSPEGTPTPTDSPTQSRTDAPTDSPTESPTDSPTGTPSETPPDTPSDTPGETSTDAPAETETATETPAETETPSSSPDQTVVVGPDGTLRFDPAEFTIAAGDTVRWEWDSGGHNVRPESTPGGSSWSGTPGGDSTTYDAGYTHSHTFETAGTYDYYCAPHRQFGMTGSFTVE